jgi:cob(I)alamin adenosyltransferase
MKVYTKTGDKGTTALISGKRVSKYNIRIEAYGSIDELMAFTAVLFDNIENPHHKDFLLQTQDRLMTAAAILAADCDNCGFTLPEITEEDIEKIEHEIDQMDAELQPLTHFILPGGHLAVSNCHVARTVCRRCERLALKVNDQEAPCPMLVKYLNRLSDYFFVLSRKLSKELKIDEISWIPRSK